MNTERPSAERGSVLWLPSKLLSCQNSEADGEVDRCGPDWLPSAARGHSGEQNGFIKDLRTLPAGQDWCCWLRLAGCETRDCRCWEDARVGLPSGPGTHTQKNCFFLLFFFFFLVLILFLKPNQVGRQRGEGEQRGNSKHKWFTELFLSECKLGSSLSVIYWCRFLRTSCLFICTYYMA